MVHAPTEWETVRSQQGYKVLARGRIDKTHEFWGITDAVINCRRIRNTYYFYFSNGLVFKCPKKSRGVGDQTMEIFDRLKEQDNFIHLCEPDMVLLEKGQVQHV